MNLCSFLFLRVEAGNLLAKIRLHIGVATNKTPLPFPPTMALGSTQPLTEMSNRNISWELKVAGVYG